MSDSQRVSSLDSSAAPELPMDSVDQLVREWRAARPELEFGPVEIVTRLRRITSHVESMLAAALANFDLNGPTFNVLSMLRRSAPPHRMSQHALMERLGVTSGTISLRIDKMVDQGLVSRDSDPRDKRGAMVSLTERGRALCDACTPAYLASEKRLLVALSADEQSTLVSLLRRLLLCFEGTPRDNDPGERLGLSLAPAHVTLETQRSVGLPERPGLLVRESRPESVAARAGLRRGDVLLQAGSVELRSLVALAEALQRAEGTLSLRVLHGLDERDVYVPLP